MKDITRYTRRGVFKLGNVDITESEILEKLFSELKQALLTADIPANIYREDFKLPNSSSSSFLIENQFVIKTSHGLSISGSHIYGDTATPIFEIYIIVTCKHGDMSVEIYASRNFLICQIDLIEY